MNSGFIKTFLLLIFSICFINVKAQTISNEGSNFWVCFPDHSPSEDILASMSIFITSKSNSSGTVICGSFNQRFSVEANKVTEVLVPRGISFIGTITGISQNKGINIKVDDGKPNIVAYAHVFAGFRSAATLILPYDALGSKYYSMNYTQQPTTGRNYFSQFNVVAADDNVKVNIQPVKKGIKGTVFSIILQKKGDVYQYQDTSDLTGSIIEVDSLTSYCKKIATFSGSSAIVIGSNTCDPTASGNASLDPLFQQLYSIENWGRRYSLIPFANRNSGSIYRILAKDNNTSITLNNQTINLNAGEFYTSNPLTNITILNASKPISVAQYALTQFCADSRNNGSSSTIKSDPDMVLLNPIEFGIDKITLYSSTKLGIQEQFLNICISTNKANSFKVNNQNFGSRFTAINGFGEFSSAQILLNEIGGSTFTLTADTTFNAVAYGFGETESYAYSAGTNLNSSFEINAINRQTRKNIKAACINEEYDFKLSLPYITDQLTWFLNPNKLPIIQNSPAYRDTLINGKKMYTYELRIDSPFVFSGIKPIKIIAALGANSKFCSNLNEQEINFEFEIKDLPVAQFTSQDSVCVGKEIKFIPSQINNSEIVSNWLWDFGDGKVSNLNNPSHVFTTPGIYKVKLIVESSFGCKSDIFEKEVYIQKLPVVSFEAPETLCVNKSITLKNTSESINSNIKWSWDFGDNSNSAEIIPSHTFSRSGTYNLSLTGIDEYGCSQTFNKTIRIVTPPSIDIKLPLSCVNDTSRFEVLTTDDNISQYLWDFGDGIPLSSENTKRNPVHKYQNTGTYQVSLTIISNANCESSISKTFTINGSDPSVDFTILKENSLCSNQEIKIQNNSTLSFGKLTRIEIIKDYHQSSTDSIFVDDHPEKGKIYSFKYPKLGTDKNYQIVIRAYSGELCFEESLPYTITIKGSPQITLEDLKPVCINSEIVKLKATETTGIVGISKWEGKGVVDDNFDPKIAGVGTHKITFTFTTLSGCEEIISEEITVFNNPELTTPKEITILLGGEKKIESTIISNPLNLKFKWSPSLGLDNDSTLNPIASPKETTKYTLIVTSSDTCESAFEIIVNVINQPKIPNVFSPNGDGINDTWVIKYLETFTKGTIKIINRFGQVVFSANPYNTPWDGRLNNIDVPVGVYYYIIDPKNGKANYTGSVTLLR